MSSFSSSSSSASASASASSTAASQGMGEMGRQGASPPPTRISPSENEFSGCWKKEGRGKMIETMQRCLCQTDKIAFRLIVSVDNVQGLTRHMIRRRCRVMERVGDEEEKGTKVEVVLSSSSKPKLWAGIIVVVIVVVVISTFCNGIT